MSFDATFWVAVSFVIFFGILVYFKIPKKINENVRSVQWRTNKELDGMFKNLMFDPQIINLTSHEVRNLPVEYKGKRLGHNWSISYVADKISF